MTARKAELLALSSKWLYAFGALAGAALVYGGFVLPAQQKPDAGTLLSMAELELKVVQMVPEGATQPEIVELRQKHLERAREHLKAVEEVQPGHAVTREMQAFACAIEGDHRGAAGWYEAALEVKNQLEPTLEVHLRLNLARSWMSAGELDRAESALQEIPAHERRPDWYVARAHILHRRGDFTARRAALAAGFRAANDDDAQRKIIAEAALDLGDDIAASCYEGLGAKSADDWYVIAKLKVRAGEFDTATEALVRVRQSKPELLEKLVSADEEFWSRYEGEGFHPLELRTNPAAGPSK